MGEWRELYNKIPPERRAAMDVQVMHDLEGMRLLDRCPYQSVAWQCVRILEDGECQFEGDYS